MKFTAVLLLFCCLFSGCTSEEKLLNQALDLRKAVIEANSCSFSAIITADYGNELYTFRMNCEADNTGMLRFIVTDPETISGISGHISNDSAALSFDETILAFPKIADEQLSPISAPWLFLNSLRGGYLTGYGKEEEGYCIYIDDTYEENALHLQIYTDEASIPIRAEFIYKDQRILSIDIKDFLLQ